ncbi:uncharacterized protein LOC106640706 [Copidosoma floridanum]|uniref:uncharacterized protein LOC106640706 n=1 Tax=Copidosoma floridanum TaxID=29053 RepID=UPI0006C9BD23|nr:uncharacterized protein LOC106640706 [Copidosoma floridanum]
MMDVQNSDLEEQCENAVFKICCTRNNYSVRSANQLEKQLSLITKSITAPVKMAPTLNFEVPTITEEQLKLFEKFSTSEKTRKESSSKESNNKNILSTLKDLESILNLIERSKNSDIQKWLKE